MARKGKVGIDYFSHDVDMLSDRKVKILKAKHGLIGYAIYLRLLEELYRDKGYYLHVDEDFHILFSDDNNLEYNAYILILNDCINKELFDKKIYEKYSILTSKRVQENYLSATERRKEVIMFDEYLLLEFSDDNIKPDNVDILTLNVDIGTQSKKKVKKKEKEIEIKTPLENAIDEFRKHRKALKKPMTDLAVNKLVNKLNKMAKDDDTKIAILEQSILNGWQGIFELKNQESNTPNTNTINTSVMEDWLRESGGV